MVFWQRAAYLILVGGHDFAFDLVQRSLSNRIATIFAFVEVGREKTAGGDSMLAVSTKPAGVRFECDHAGTRTVLEGAELYLLIRRFLWHEARHRRKHGNVEKAFLLAILSAYLGLYGRSVVGEYEMRDLSSAGARKLDLFYKGMLVLLSDSVPEGGWEAFFGHAPSLFQATNEVLMLKPNFFGIGLDLNFLLRRLRFIRSS